MPYHIKTPAKLNTGDVITIHPHEGTITRLAEENNEEEIVAIFDLKPTTISDEIQAGGRIPLMIGRALTDKVRSKHEFKRNILEGLNWIGLNYDDKPYIQSERIKRHQQVALKLLENKKAFKCICKPAELEKKRSENKSKNIND